jgi:hypothetical protein
MAGEMDKAKGRAEKVAGDLMDRESAKGPGS